MLMHDFPKVFAQGLTPPRREHMFSDFKAPNSNSPRHPHISSVFLGKNVPSLNLFYYFQENMTDTFLHANLEVGSP